MILSLEEMKAEAARLLAVFDKQDQGVTVLAERNKGSTYTAEQIVAALERSRRDPTAPQIIVKITGSKAKFVVVNEEDAKVMPFERPSNGSANRKT